MQTWLAQLAAGLERRSQDRERPEAKLAAKGAKFTRGPETIRPGTRIAFIEGPEGVSIELLERGPHIT